MNSQLGGTVSTDSNVIDYNGNGRWAKDSILGRYLEYCQRFHIKARDLTPRESVKGNCKWIYPVMEQVIEGINQGDKACVLIGVEFIEDDQKFSFGKILKANAAKALRQQHGELCESERERIRKRVLSLLQKGLVPHEFREYAKLAKKVGLDSYKEELNKIDKSNPYVAKFVDYLIN